MAIFHLSVQVLGRSANHKVVAAAAYRSGEALQDERYAEVHDYTRKGGVVHAEIMAPEAAPSWAGDREQLWNIVEAGEKRKDAQLAREIEVALHRELSFEENLALMRRFIANELVDRGMIADFAIHERPASDGATNPHAHVLLSMRRVTAEGFESRKERDWNDDALVEVWRERWAEYSNEALEAAGSDFRIDHRTLEAQGILRDPTIHLGKDAFHAAERGVETARSARQPSAVERSMGPFERQIEELGHVDMTMTPEVGESWFEWMSSYTSRISETVQEVYDWTVEKVRGWVDYVRGPGPSMER